MCFAEEIKIDQPTIQHQKGVFYYNHAIGQYCFKPTACVDISEPTMWEITRKLHGLNVKLLENFNHSHR